MAPIRYYWLSAQAMTYMTRDATVRYLSNLARSDLNLVAQV